MVNRGLVLASLSVFVAVALVAGPAFAWAAEEKLTGKVTAYEAGKSVTVESDGAQKAFTINEETKIEGDLAVGKTVEVTAKDGVAVKILVNKERVRLRVAGAQIPVSRDVRKNVEAISRAIEYAKREKADVLVTPEGSLSGYFADFDAAATAKGIEEVVAKAREAGVALVLGTCFEDADGKRYNAQRFTDREGRYLGFHAKILLCRRVADPRSKGEIDSFQTKPLETLSLGGLTVGGLVCNDVWANPEWTPMDDPHLVQKLSGLGARVIFHSVNAGQGEGDEWELNRTYHETNLRMRARSGKVWIVTVDAADPESRRASHAPSGVVAPDGTWAVKTPPKGEQFFAHTIEVSR
jgi:predicted amidohydrolase